MACNAATRSGDRSNSFSTREEGAPGASDAELEEAEEGVEGTAEDVGETGRGDRGGAEGEVDTALRVRVGGGVADGTAQLGAV